MRNKLLAAVVKAKIGRFEAAPVRRPVPANPVVRRVAFGTFNEGATAVLDGLDRVSESKPPPPGFPRLKYFGPSECPGESYFRSDIDDDAA